jgi:hypothetical protein
MLLKHLKDDQWKEDALELNFESHNKGAKYQIKSILILFVTCAKYNSHLTVKCLLYKPLTNNAVLRKVSVKYNFLNKSNK